MPPSSRSNACRVVTFVEMNVEALAMSIPRTSILSASEGVADNLRVVRVRRGDDA